jgi:Flp pilus assembly protein TadD
MRLHYPVLMASSVLVGGAVPGLSQSAGDGSDLFLSAYTNFQKADAMEKKGDRAGALAMYEQVAKTLQQISAQHPGWNPQVVKLRTQYTEQAIQRLRATGAGLAGAKEGGNKPTRKGEESVAAPGGSAGVAGGREAGAGAGMIPKLPERGGVPMAPADPFSEIQSKLTQLQNDLQFALEEAQRLRREKADLATQLAEMTQGRQKAEGELRLVEQRSDIAERALMQSREQNIKAAEEIALLQKDRDVLKRQKLELQAEHDASEELRRRLEGRLAQAQTRETTVIGERDAANQKLGEANKQVAQVQGSLEKESKERGQVQGKLEKVIGEREEAKRLAEAAMKERDSEKVAKEKALVGLGEKEKALVQAGLERDAAKATLTKVAQERDDAVALTAKLKEARSQIDRLEKENSEAAAKLAKAQQLVNERREAGGQTADSMKALKEEVDAIKVKLADSQKKAQASEKSAVELQAKLDEAMKETATTKAAAKAEVSSAGAEREREKEEREVLEGILRRSLVEQGKREEARKALLAEVGRLKIDSEVLSKQIGMLSEPVVQLSEKERAMFKQPRVEISEEGISISAIKKQPAKAAPVPAAAPASAAKAAEGSAGGAKKPEVSAAGSVPAGPAPAPAAAVVAKKEMGEGGASGNKEDLLRTKMSEAKDHFEKGHFEVAEKLYQEAAQLAPDNAFVHSNLGVTQFRAKQYSRSEESLKRAIELAPQDAFSRSTLGMVYYTQGKLDKSIEELTQSVGINPNNAVAHNYLGIAASRKGWQENARKELETASALDPNYADAFFNLAVVCISQRQPDKAAARAAYKRATELGAEPDPRLEELMKD